MSKDKSLIIAIIVIIVAVSTVLVVKLWGWVNTGDGSPKMVVIIPKAVDMKRLKQIADSDPAANLAVAVKDGDLRFIAIDPGSPYAIFPCEYKDIVPKYIGKYGKKLEPAIPTAYDGSIAPTVDKATDNIMKYNALLADYLISLDEQGGVSPAGNGDASNRER